MILSIQHPDLDEQLFRRLFGALSPHTTGPTRPCVSCHHSPVALGLGKGRLEHRDGRWHFQATQPALADGLPADAWTTLEADQPGAGSHPGDRSFNRDERLRILDSGRKPIQSLEN